MEARAAAPGGFPLPDESHTANPRLAEVDAQRALAQLMLEAKEQRWPRLMRPFAAEVKRRLLLHVDSCPSWAESGMCNTCCGLWARTAAWQEKTGAQIPQSSRALDSADERTEDDGSEPECESPAPIPRGTERPTSPAASPEDACVVCMTNRKNFAYVPCGHLCVCSSCAEMETSCSGGRCPICRAQAEKLLRIYS